MLNASDCLRRFGTPGTNTEGRYMRLWIVPEDLGKQLPALPRRIYCNAALVAPLEEALRLVVSRGLAQELKTWDGCYQVRNKRGHGSLSLHSWGVAVDLNAAWNGFGKRPTLSLAFVQCFMQAGFDWGGHWSKPDGMHFQLVSLP